MRRLSDLVAIIERLRGPDGCPWDRAQNWHTMRPYLVEETYEVLDAVNGGAPEAVAGAIWMSTRTGVLFVRFGSGSNGRSPSEPVGEAAMDRTRAPSVE